MYIKLIAIATLLQLTAAVAHPYPAYNRLTLTIVATPQGACTDAADVSIFNAYDAVKFNSVVSQCAHESYGDAESSTTCIESSTHLSHACCTCYGADVGCMSSNCMSACIMDEASAGCLDCHKKNCLPALEACTGITHSQMSIE